MNRKLWSIGLLLVFAAELAVLFFYAAKDTGGRQESVMVNEVVQAVQADWNAMEYHQSQTGLDYVVLDNSGNIRFKTKEGLSESLNEAVIHRDTILDLEVDGVHIGKLIVYNNTDQIQKQQKQKTIFLLLAILLVQNSICIAYMIYTKRTIVRPFCKLKGFAERVAGGNLDIPLEMDRRNLFGAFTESFDIMRAELKKARLAEAKANASKKELVAKLSHDIKTPVASIKAASEVGAALADNEKIRENYTQIIHKADQINTLISNLFTATLEELQQLAVTPTDIESDRVRNLLENADYLHRAELPEISACLLYADPLRLQQVFDNIFANSYKYADTKVKVTAAREGSYFTIALEDYGGGVPVEELPLLKEKFWRGSNAREIDGAGLGLYISDYFIKEMKGELVVENGACGLKVSVILPLSGKEL